MKLSNPLKGFSKNLISQTFHDKHKALDIISTFDWYKRRGSGTPLCAPERCEIIKITGDTFTPGNVHNIERGYGIYLKGLETGFTHLYWHIKPVVPVSLGQVVERGKIVAFMGNAGLVYSDGVYVPIEDRTKDPNEGTHLHWEVFDQTYKIGGKKTFVNPLDYLDFSIEPTYTTSELLGAISKVLLKTLNLLQ